MKGLLWGVIECELPPVASPLPLPDRVVRVSLLPILCICPFTPNVSPSLITRILFSFVGKIQSSCALQGMIRHVIPCRNNNPDRTTTHEPELFNGNQVRIELFMYNVINFIVSRHYYCNIQHMSSTKIVLNSHSVLDRQE